MPKDLEPLAAGCTILVLFGLQILLAWSGILLAKLLPGDDPYEPWVSFVPVALFDAGALFPFALVALHHHALSGMPLPLASFFAAAGCVLAAKPVLQAALIARKTAAAARPTHPR